MFSSFSTSMLHVHALTLTVTDEISEFMTSFEQILMLITQFYAISVLLDNFWLTLIY